MGGVDGHILNFHHDGKDMLRRIYGRHDTMATAAHPENRTSSAAVAEAIFIGTYTLPHVGLVLMMLAQKASCK